MPRRTIADRIARDGLRMAGAGVVATGSPSPLAGSGVPPQSEASFQAQVVAYARLRGWRVWHDAATNTPRRCGACGAVRRTPRNAAGLPDLLLVRRPRLVVVELKREGARPTPDQQAWLTDLAACGIAVHVWWPSDWASVVKELA